MSRYTVPHPTLTIVVGFDPPLETFFAMVDDMSKPEEEQEVLWVGCTRHALTTVVGLQTALAPYATLAADLWEHLKQDQAQADPPTPLQRHMIRMLERIRTMP